MVQQLIVPTMDTFDDEQFYQFCIANKHHGSHFERDKFGQIFFMSPTGSIGGARDMMLSTEIQNWNKIQKNGYVFGAAAGFTLPDGSVKSPDTAWISKKRWATVPKELREKFAPVCPEFVVEIQSYSDSWQELQNKMRDWIDNGVELGWLIDPFRKKTMIFTPQNLNPDEQDFGVMNGGGVLIDLQIDLNEVFEEYE
jgi:Uma2 family endonuclease